MERRDERRGAADNFGDPNKDNKSSFFSRIVEPQSVSKGKKHSQWYREKKAKQPSDAANQSTPPPKERSPFVEFLIRLFSELVGTFILVVMLGSLGALQGMGKIDIGAHALGDGATLLLLVYSLGEVGGAHFNPCVTAAMALHGLFPYEWVIPYWISQFIGSIIAGGVIRALFKGNAWRATGGILPPYSLAEGMGAEVLFTFILVFVILSICNRGRVVGPTGALAVGAAISALIVFGDNVTSGSMNPFRSLGPAIVNGPISHIWVYVAGPFLGMLIALFTVEALSWNKPVTEDAKGAATGEGGQTLA